MQEKQTARAGRQAMNSVRMTRALAAALAMAGCGGGGVSAPLLDMGAVGDGDGSLDAPYVLPAEHPAGTTGGIGDYFDVGGVWEFGYDSRQVDLGSGPAPVFKILKYDTSADTWILEVNDNEFELTDPTPGDGNYESSGCPASSIDCVELEPYQIAGTRLYGIFAVGWYQETDVQTALLAYGGMKTPVDSMPGSGSAVYIGAFRGFVTNLGGSSDPQDIDGAVVISPNFGDGTINFTIDGLVDADGDATPDRYNLNGSALIVGNTYTDNTVGGEVRLDETDPEGLADFTYTGSIEGAFFGPGAAQTAGVVSTVEDSGSGVLAGGFWAAK